MAKLSNRCALNHFDASSLLVLLCGSFFFFLSATITENDTVGLDLWLDSNYIAEKFFILSNWCSWKTMLYLVGILGDQKIILISWKMVNESYSTITKKKSTKLKDFKIKFCWETCSKVYLKNFLFENVCERVYTPYNCSTVVNVWWLY